MGCKIYFEERSFGGKFFRPTPNLSFDPSLGTAICVTCWGDPEPGDKILEDIKSFISLSAGDNEVTVPYPKKTSLNSEGNVLRMSVILSSEKVFRKYNETEYSAGFEIFAGTLTNNQFVYVSCGQPNLIFCKKQDGAFPLVMNHDLNFQTSPSEFLSPLPNSILGMGQHPPLNFGNQKVESGDFCLIISRSYLPTELFTFNSESLDLNSVSRILAEDNPDIPFWLGILRFE